MQNIAEIVKTLSLVTAPSKPEEPKGTLITLSVCSCYSFEQITFIMKKAELVAAILGITTQDLECAAVTAMFMGQPEVVAFYNQRDLAEQRLSQLRALTPFIAKSRHSFDLASDT